MGDEIGIEVLRRVEARRTAVGGSARSVSATPRAAARQRGVGCDLTERRPRSCGSAARRGARGAIAPAWRLVRERNRGGLRAPARPWWRSIGYTRGRVGRIERIETRATQPPVRGWRRARRAALALASPRPALADRYEAKPARREVPERAALSRLTAHPSQLCQQGAGAAQEHTAASLLPADLQRDLSRSVQRNTRHRRSRVSRRAAPHALSECCLITGRSLLIPRKLTGLTTALRT